MRGAWLVRRIILAACNFIGRVSFPGPVRRLFARHRINERPCRDALQLAIPSDDLRSDDKLSFDNRDLQRQNFVKLYEVIDSVGPWIRIISDNRRRGKNVKCLRSRRQIPADVNPFDFPSFHSFLTSTEWNCILHVIYLFIYFFRFDISPKFDFLCYIVAIIFFIELMIPKEDYLTVLSVIEYYSIVVINFISVVI